MSYPHDGDGSPSRAGNTRLREQRRSAFYWIALLCLLLLLTGQARADEWTSKDTAWEAAYMTLLVVDWGQTLYIAEHPDRHTEGTIDWAIGKHPSRANVNAYFLFVAIMHPIVAYNLPSKFYIFGLKVNPRLIFQFVSIGEKTYWAHHNYRIGVGFEF